MDSIVHSMPGTTDGDLIICDGVAYQWDMTALVEYGDEYIEHYRRLEGSEVCSALNAGRCALLARHARPGASVLDIGSGAGTFVRAAMSWGFEARGFDVSESSAQELKQSGLFADDPAPFQAVTFWDSLEHIPDPGPILDRIGLDSVVLVALPVFRDLSKVRESKHYKPGEHLYYWTVEGFVRWMAARGFRLIETSDHETKAGRESIQAFAFVRDAVPCLCGGSAYLDSFYWPKRGREWFLRCEQCGGMSDASTARADVRSMRITAGQCRQEGQH